MNDLVQSVRHLEDVTVITLLGIRFWDAALDEQVRDNLVVTARRQVMHGPSLPAFRTASGIYAFQGLPGLRDYENGTIGWLPSPLQREWYVIQVRDLRRRFLPALFRVALPLPYRGIYPGSSASPPGDGTDLPGFYLFSAPTRPAVPGLAAVRARLVDQATGLPAAHATLEVDTDGTVWRGIADAGGQVTLLFPYPTMHVQLHSSPPGLLSAPLYQQQWELTIRVSYEPPALDYSDGENLPELASILRQSPGLVWPTQAGAPVDEWTWSLTFGQELILNTDGLSDLWIESGA